MNTRDVARPDTRHSDAQKGYFVCFTEPADAPLEEVEAIVPAHKEWAAAAEAAGRLLVAGPFLAENFKYSGFGMLVPRASTATEAAEIVEAAPMHAKWLRRFRIVRWQLNEGTMPISLRLSTGAFSFD